MSALAAGLAVLFRDPHLSAAATYTGPGEDPEPVALRVVPLGGDALLRLGAVEIPGVSAGFQVRAADVAAPVPGAVLAVAGVNWTIVGPPLADSRGLVWTLQAQRR